jgi:hypothetical protein
MPFQSLYYYILGFFSRSSVFTALLMGTEMIPETSVFFNQLTSNTAIEDFSKTAHRESFRSLINFIEEPLSGEVNSTLR